MNPFAIGTLLKNWHWILIGLLIVGITYLNMRLEYVKADRSAIAEKLANTKAAIDMLESHIAIVNQAVAEERQKQEQRLKYVNDLQWEMYNDKSQACGVSDMLINIIDKLPERK